MGLKELTILLAAVSILLSGCITDHSNSTDGPKNSSTGETISYTVNCPKDIEKVCEKLSERYKANISYMFEAEYTNRNGSLHRVELNANHDISHLNSSKAVARIDDQSKELLGIFPPR
ncbi:MAG: hypothetical protein MUP58_02310 [Candidatus Nanohaloarchaeota archaeon QJJ-9]|nr:hypothetical protein [Candidatus Nanohaloarchaeota archaeon QJJ-9]